MPPEEENKPRTCRKYTSEQRARGLAALKANAGNVTLTAREIGVPVRTLRSWAAAAGLDLQAMAAAGTATLPVCGFTEMSLPPASQTKKSPGEQAAALLPAAEAELADSCFTGEVRG
jgi:transposase-like protein